MTIDKEIDNMYADGTKKILSKYEYQKITLHAQDKLISLIRDGLVPKHIKDFFDDIREEVRWNYIMNEIEIEL